MGRYTYGGGDCGGDDGGDDGGGNGGGNGSGDDGDDGSGDGGGDGGGVAGKAELQKFPPELVTAGILRRVKVGKVAPLQM